MGTCSHRQVLCKCWMEKQCCFNGQLMSKMDGHGIFSQVELQGGSFGHRWERWSYIPVNPAAVRTSGGITAQDSSKGGLRRDQRCGCTEVCAEKRGKEQKKTQRMSSRHSSMPTTSQAKLSQVFHAGEAIVWRPGIDNKGA